VLKNLVKVTSDQIKMVMNTESKEVNRNNGKKSSSSSPLFSSTNAKQQQPIDDLTPETSEDEDNSKLIKQSPDSQTIF
jgi:hypothetical protein